MLLLRHTSLLIYHPHNLFSFNIITNRDMCAWQHTHARTHTHSHTNTIHVITADHPPTQTKTQAVSVAILLRAQIPSFPVSPPPPADRHIRDFQCSVHTAITVQQLQTHPHFSIHLLWDVEEGQNVCVCVLGIMGEGGGQVDELVIDVASAVGFP